MLQEMRDDIKEIKTDNREIKPNMQQMSSKIVSMEQQQKENEERTATKFLDIRREMQENKTVMQESISANVIEKLKPVIAENQVNAEEVIKIVEEVLAKR